MEEDQIFINELQVPEICLQGLAHERLKESILHCQACSSAKLTKPLTLHNNEASLMIVGERADDVLFDSPQGKQLANLMAAANLDMKDVYFSSLLKCRESSEAANCQHHLIGEVMLVRPKLVICLGYNVCQVFDLQPDLGSYCMIYPNVHALFTYSVSDASGNQELIVLRTIQEQFSYVAQTIRHMKQQSA
ncbi:uracil-DNA glycosylase, family 4 [Paenibacillus sp. UNC496MF]|uniref:uracil-DNA glycosylase family protein n=1 Tax=Paenibacillus sp. UNC496MF TaxID=1502753 RepID=UPI0008EB0D3B|nr:uracil-DNA glycosylase family protein [Paenibacillus sp. UNC496MF]SFJ63590.1 uracil-DNA glycosylase, family 4 [Paenibacillus sp. UNC496MF]